MEKIVDGLKIFELDENTEATVANYLECNNFHPMLMAFKTNGLDYFTIDQNNNSLFLQHGEYFDGIEALDGYRYNMKINYKTNNGIFQGINIDLDMERKVASKTKGNFKYKISLNNSLVEMTDGNIKITYKLDLTNEELEDAYNNNNLLDLIIKKMQQAISYRIIKNYNESITNIKTNLENNKENPLYLLRMIFGVKNKFVAREVSNYLSLNKYILTSMDEKAIYFQNEEKKCKITMGNYGKVYITEEGICLDEESPFIGKYIISDTDVDVSLNENGDDIIFSSFEYVYNTPEDENPICYYGRKNNEGYYHGNSIVERYNFVLPREMFGIMKKKKDGSNVIIGLTSMREAGKHYYCKLNKIKNNNKSLVTYKF